MTFLAIDTASKSMGIALADSSRVLFESVWQSKNYHSVELAPAIERALSQTRIEMSALKAIALAIGPGSYTGLRIGLALAKGMATSLGIPLIPIKTLDIMAAGIAPEDKPLIVLIQAGRSRFNAGMYAAKEGQWQPKQEAYLTIFDDLYESINTPTLVCGEFSSSERKKLARKKTNIHLLSPAFSVRRPAILAQLARQAVKSEPAPSIIGLEPHYLKSIADLSASPS